MRVEMKDGFMDYQEHFETLCCWCDAPLNSSIGTTPHQSRPMPGDLTLCESCFQPMMFTDTGLRKPTAEEQQEINQDVECQRVLQSMVKAKSISVLREIYK